MATQMSMNRLIEDTSKTIANILDVPLSNIEIRQDSDYMIAEVLINGENITTEDDLKQIDQMSGFRFDSWRVEPAKGLRVFFTHKLEFGAELS